MPTLAEIKRVQDEMAGRSQKWLQTNDPNQRKQLSDANLQQGTTIGAKRNESTGTWDYSGVKIDPDPKPNPMGDYQSSIDAMMNAEKAQRLQALKQQQAKYTGQLNQQKAEVQPQYYAKRNDADANMAQSKQRLSELIAQSGLTSSGENITANVAHNAARQNVLGDLNLQEQQTLNDFNRRIADVNDPSQEQAISAALDAEKARMLFDAKQKADAMQYQIGRDTKSDAFNEAQLTGAYLDPDTRAKIDRLNVLKDANATGLFPQMKAEADMIRADLSSHGIDANRLFGADVAPGQSKTNAGLVGIPTMASKQFNWGQTMDEAGLTGYYNGKPTLARDNATFTQGVQTAGLTGYLNGKPTFDREQFNAQQGDKQVAAAWKAAEAIGQVTPELAQILNVPAGTSLSQVKQTPAGKNAAMSSVVADIEAMTPENRKKFFQEQKAAIVDELGMSGYGQLYDMYMDKYGDPKQ